MLAHNMANIEIAWALSENLDGIVHIERTMANANPHPKSYFEECLRYGRIVWALNGNEPAAYLTYEVLWGNTAFLALLKVLPRYQRCGIGKSMIAILERRLVELGFKSYVTSSEQTNPNTKKFFPDLGFVRIGDLNMQHGNEIFYLKELS